MGTSVFHPDASFTAWGPFIHQPYIIQPTTKSDLIIASTVFGLTISLAALAAYRGIKQTKASRRPLKSVYVWMIWLELVASVVIAILCLLYLVRIVRPSFYFYMAILFLWSIQIQLLLQIIINRIRIILQDRKKGRIMLISIAIFVTFINISVFCIWMPARLQISERYIHINNVWDRVEKVLYLLVDGCLNWYFIRVVNKNLVENGLHKYYRLVRFNQRIIVFSLLMDVMIIASMSIPNGFVYAIFHPLAFLVKLNIEMTMANLIRKIALDTHDNRNSFLVTFASVSTEAPQPLMISRSVSQRGHPRWLPSLLGANSRWHRSSHQEDGIRKTEEFSVLSRRRSQLSTQLLRGQSDKLMRKRQNSLGLEEMSLGSAEEGSRGSGAGSFDEVDLVTPEPVVRRCEDR